MLTLAKHTVQDYMELPEGGKYQLINGEIIEMPSPIPEHQDIIASLHLLMGSHVTKNKLGKVYFAPLDIFFDDENVLQPDLLFISNENKHIIKERISGAPDLVVEVLSPSTAYYDWEEKMEIYAKFGVKEYWIINPQKKYIEVYKNINNVFSETLKLYHSGTIKTDVIQSFEFELLEIFTAS